MQYFTLNFLLNVMFIVIIKYFIIGFSPIYALEQEYTPYPFDLFSSQYYIDNPIYSVSADEFTNRICEMNTLYQTESRNLNQTYDENDDEVFILCPEVLQLVDYFDNYSGLGLSKKKHMMDAVALLNTFGDKTFFTSQPDRVVQDLALVYAASGENPIIFHTIVIYSYIGAQLTYGLEPDPNFTSNVELYNQFVQLIIKQLGYIFTPPM
jgi:hypothetical protein